MTKQIDLVQDSLIGAIERLLKKKSFDEISVSELTKVAGISRPTFYRHYHNIVDILNVEMRLLLIEFLDDVSYEKQNNYEYILNMISFFKVHKRIIKIILDAKHEELIRQNISRVLGQLSSIKPQNVNLSEYEEHYYVMYHTAGLMTVIIDWIDNDQPISVERLAHFFR